MTGTGNPADSAPKKTALHQNPQSEDYGDYDARRFKGTPAKIPKEPNQGPFLGRVAVMEVVYGSSSIRLASLDLRMTWT